eukprot:GHVS01046995.1.p1 GENE.GHVS01046995.1~~GHVS01046995.1.p1  ORF type:complete len:103 (-),score=10.23 GHVS01046995.1:168-476(-)
MCVFATTKTFVDDKSRLTHLLSHCYIIAPPQAPMHTHTPAATPTTHHPIPLVSSALKQHVLYIHTLKRHTHRNLSQLLAKRLYSASLPAFTQKRGQLVPHQK